MKLFNLILTLVFVVAGGPAFAALPNSSQQVHEWVDYLNHYYPDLQLQIANVGAPADLENLEHELEALEIILRGEVALPPNSLQLLTCRRPQCGGF